MSPTINLGTPKKRDVTANKRYQTSFYNSPAWRGSRKKKGLRQLKFAANPLCEKCEAKGLTVLTDEVHHKIPWETGMTLEMQWELFVDWKNLESLCTTCHHEEEMKLKHC
jgi:5-methylcytosine-specific restriction endonuclease McrA